MSGAIVIALLVSRPNVNALLHEVSERILLRAVGSGKVKLVEGMPQNSKFWTRTPSMMIAIGMSSLRLVSQPCIFPYRFTHPHSMQKTRKTFRISALVYNRGPYPATLHILPQFWFPNNWPWSESSRCPPTGEHNSLNLPPVLLSFPTTHRSQKPRRLR